MHQSCKGILKLRKPLAGKEAPKDKAKLIGEYLDKTTTLMEKLKRMAETTAIVKALPLLASMRHLFGLPQLFIYTYNTILIKNFDEKEC